jgi:hypothetical protein
MQEGPLNMVWHSLMIAIIFYAIAVYILGHRRGLAYNRSFLVFAIALTYMLLFGHGLPWRINRNLYN